MVLKVNYTQSKMQTQQQVKTAVLNILKKRTTAKNANLLSTNIHNALKEMPLEEYKRHSYDYVGVLMNKSIPLKDTLKDIKGNKLGWDVHIYSDYVAKREIENVRSTRPTAIADGTFKCKNCNNKKIITYSLQLRSGDEAMTHFFMCVMCGKGWRKG